MIEIIALVAVCGLVLSNIFLIHIAFKTKLLEKSEDIFEYKNAVEPAKPREEIKEDEVFTPIY